jgi:GTP-binding protein EngB required for normal cell division
MRTTGLQYLQAVANAAVRSVQFVTGAVSMETLPKKWLPEAAFIGRSNVGKSSLINMVCNRKALAYTSKRPGKTQQFNYFEVNGEQQSSSGSGSSKGGSSKVVKPAVKGRIDAQQAFYIVDLPGIGYAKVPQYVSYNSVL